MPIAVKSPQLVNSKFNPSLDVVVEQALQLSDIETTILCQRPQDFITLFELLVTLNDDKEIYLFLSSSLQRFNLIQQYIIDSLPRLLPNLINLIAEIDSPIHILTQALFFNPSLNNTSFLSVALQHTPMSIERLVILMQRLDSNKRMAIYTQTSLKGCHILFSAILYAPNYLNFIIEAIQSEPDGHTLLSQLIYKKEIGQDSCMILAIKTSYMTVKTLLNLHVTIRCHEKQAFPDIIDHDVLMASIRYLPKALCLLLNNCLSQPSLNQQVAQAFNNLKNHITPATPKASQQAFKLLELANAILDIDGIIADCKEDYLNNPKLSPEYQDSFDLSQYLKQCFMCFTDNQHYNYQNIAWLVQSYEKTQHNFKSCATLGILYLYLLDDLKILYKIKPIETVRQNKNGFFESKPPEIAQEEAFNTSCCVLM